MGINSKCYLPNDIRAEDIVQAIAYLCGAERIHMKLPSGGGVAAWINRNEVLTEPNSTSTFEGRHVSIRHTHDMQYYIIQIAPTTCDRKHHEGSLFLYPDENHLGYYCLYAGVSEFWHKIDRALIDMFGGYVDDNDCDSVDVDYRKRKPRSVNCPGDGQAWQDYQNDLLNLSQLFSFIDD